MEEFRPLVADSVAIAMINNAEIQLSDFISRAGAAGLTETGRRHVLAAYERRMDTLITHPLFGYSISYRRVLEVQARLLSRCVTGELNRYIPFCTRWAHANHLSCVLWHFRWPETETSSQIDARIRRTCSVFRVSLRFVRFGKIIDVRMLESADQPPWR